MAYKTIIQEVEVRVFKNLALLIDDMQEFADPGDIDLGVKFQAYDSPRNLALGFGCFGHDIRWQIHINDLKASVHEVSDRVRILLRTAQGQVKLAGLIPLETFDPRTYQEQSHDAETQHV